jgi:hypothetical protein
MSLAKKLRTVMISPRQPISYDDAVGPTASNEEEADILNYLVGCTPQGAALPTAAASTSVTSQAPGGGVQEKDVKMSNPAPALCQNGKFDRGTRDGWQPSGVTTITKGSLSYRGLAGFVEQVEVVDPTLVAHPKDSTKRMFKKVLIHTTLEATATGDIPVEEIIRPRGWFSPKYANQAIGTEIYGPFFGCSSVIDDLMSVTGSKPDTTRGKEQTTPTVPAVGGNRVVGDLLASMNAGLFNNIENSINSLAFQYGTIRLHGNMTEIEDFIRGYTRRSIATMEEILGTPNMMFSVTPDGKATPVNKEDTVGFHTTAFNSSLLDSKVPLAGLVDDVKTQLPRIGEAGKRTPILGNYDVRSKKKERVARYLLALNASRGLHG